VGHLIAGLTAAAVIALYLFAFRKLAASNSPFTDEESYAAVRIARQDDPPLTGELDVAFAVMPDGTATGFRILRSSGSDALDKHASSLIYRLYRPAPDIDEVIAAQRIWQTIRLKIRDGDLRLEVVRTRREAAPGLTPPLGLGEPDWASFSHYHHLDMAWANWEQAESPDVGAVTNGPILALIDLSFRPGISNFIRARGLEGISDWFDPAKPDGSSLRLRAEARLDEHIQRCPELAWLRDIWLGNAGHHSAPAD
jgi:TonB family protein